MSYKKTISAIKFKIFGFIKDKRRIYYFAMKLKVRLDKKLKLSTYKLSSVKDYCINNDLNYSVVEEEQLREVFIPRFYGDIENEKTEKLMSPEVYVAELCNVSIVGSNGFILSDNDCLYDLAAKDNENRYQLAYESIKIIHNNTALIEYIHTEGVITEGIFLIGFAPFNYYHFSIEIVSRLQYIDSSEKYIGVPLLIDEIILNIPQYADLLKKVNKANRKIISIKKNYKYKIRKLIYPSYNTWMPINIRDSADFRNEDSLVSISAIEYMREQVLCGEKAVGNKKIFLSRKNQQNPRLINEKEVSELFERNGFDVIYPENMSFHEQLEVFKQAGFVAGATGAAFTNILYCPSNAKIICIIPKKYNFNIYSTVSGLLGLECTFLDATVFKEKKTVSGERFSLDLESCETFLKSLN